MVKWVRGRLHRGLVLRCAKSMMQIWVNWSLLFSFHWQPHDMWVWAEAWEECGRKTENSCIITTWILDHFSWFHHVFCRCLSAVRHWQRDWSTTRPWQTWICLTTTLALKGLRPGVWWGWTQRIGAEMSIVFFLMTNVTYSRELRVGVRRHVRKQCRFLLHRQGRAGRFTMIYQVHDRPTKNSVEAPA